jgi:hypothetical protein
MDSAFDHGKIDDGIVKCLAPGQPLLGPWSGQDVIDVRELYTSQLFPFGALIFDAIRSPTYLLGSMGGARPVRLIARCRAARATNHSTTRKGAC